MYFILLFIFYYTLFGGLAFVNTEWSRRPDSNRGPTVYKTVALPLSYAGRYILFAKNSFANTLNSEEERFELSEAFTSAV